MNIKNRSPLKLGGSISSSRLLCLHLNMGNSNWQEKNRNFLICYHLCMKNIDIDQKLSIFTEHWSPKIIASANGQDVKLAKFSGSFDWHSHADADEMFLVIDGEFTMEFREHAVELKSGQMIVVPKGVEHRPVAESECSVMLIEPAGLVNTGDGEKTDRSTSGEWI